MSDVLKYVEAEQGYRVAPVSSDKILFHNPLKQINIMTIKVGLVTSLYSHDINFLNYNPFNDNPLKLNKIIIMTIKAGLVTSL